MCIRVRSEVFPKGRHFTRSDKLYIIKVRKPDKEVRTIGINPVSYTHLDVYKRQIIQSSGNRTFPSIQIFDLPVNRAVLLLKKLLDAFRIPLIQLLPDLFQGHAVILHVLNHVQPRGLDDVIIAVSGIGIGNHWSQQPFPIIQPQRLLRNPV